MPPLRGRREDIPLLIRVISRQLAARYALPPLPAAALRSAEMMKLFTSWEWPGNIRELRGLLLRMMTMYSVTGRIGMEETRALLEENAALEISAGKEAEEDVYKRQHEILLGYSGLFQARHIRAEDARPDAADGLRAELSVIWPRRAVRPAFS